MVGIVQLAAGGSEQAPPGAISIRLSSTAPAQLVLVGDDGRVVEPQFRVSGLEVVFVPGAQVLVTARTTTGQPFASGTRIGASLRNPAGAGREIVRPAVEVGGQQSVTLVRIGGDGLISDAMADARRRGDGEGLWSRPWLKVGSYAYHVNHQVSTSAAVNWAVVVDGSASLLVADRRAALGEFLETLVGIAATAWGCAPRALLVASDPVKDAVEALNSDRIDWAGALGEDPAPWPRVTHAVIAASAEVSAVALVLDGVPVDYRELTAWARATRQRLLVVVVGKSKYGVRPLERPTQFWEEELAALDELAALENVTLVATTDFAASVADSSGFADALFLTRNVS